MRRTYTPSQVARALAQLELNSGRVRQTALQLDMPWSTLVDWRDKAIEVDPTLQMTLCTDRAQNRDYVQLWAEAQELAVTEALRMAPRLADRPSGDSLRALAILGGIASDKLLDHRDGRKGTEVHVDNRQVYLHVDDALVALREARGRLRLEAAPPSIDT